MLVCRFLKLQLIFFCILIRSPDLWSLENTSLDNLWVPLVEAMMCGIVRSQSVAGLCFPPVWSFVISNDDNPSVHTVQNEDKLN